MVYIQSVVEFYLLLCLMGAIRLLWIFFRQEWRHQHSAGRTEDAFHHSYVFWIIGVAQVLPVINIPVWLLFIIHQLKRHQRKS